MSAEFLHNKGIDFEIGSNPFRPEKGISVTAIGHQKYEDFSEELLPELERWGFQGDLNISPDNIKHDYRPCRNTSDALKLMTLKIDGAMLPVTYLVNYHIPLFGYFAKHDQERLK